MLNISCADGRLVASEERLGSMELFSFLRASSHLNTHLPYYLKQERHGCACTPDAVRWRPLVEPSEKGNFLTYEHYILFIHGPSCVTSN
jgi:hypothetical protein